MRYRIALIAIGFHAVLLSPQSQELHLAPGSEPVVAQGPQESEDATSDEGDNKPFDPFGIRSALENIATAIRSLAPEEDRANSDRQNQREVEDLEAQKQMAWWAMWMFVGTAATVLLTFAALMAILRTLHHTKRAADYAESMVEEARNATRAANETFGEARRSNDIAHENMLAQNRPWLTLDATHAGPVELVDDSVLLNIYLVTKNVSKFPARLVVINTKAYWTQNPYQWPDINNVNRLVEETKTSPYVEQKSSVMLPGGDLPYGFIKLNAVRHPVVPKGEQHGTIDRKSPINIVVVCCVVYKSTLSEKWHHTAHLMYVRRKHPEGLDPRAQIPILLNTGEIKSDDISVSIAKFSAANSVS